MAMSENTKFCICPSMADDRVALTPVGSTEIPLLLDKNTHFGY
jgi:hypothetical protein